MTLGKVHSCESFGAADGPGVRYVVFLYGCAFRCLYCHNPDTWAGGEFRELSAEEVLAQALRYRDYWGEAGGITVSGGEPLLQAEFVAELFERARAEGVSTCLDTAAGPFDVRDEAQRRVFAACDTAIVDIKAFDDDAHRRLTGFGNASVLDCLRHLDSLALDIWVRRVLVPGLTDDERDLVATGEFIRSLAHVRRVEILPYHVLGVGKYRRLGLSYALEDALPPDEREISRAERLMGIKR